MRLIEIQNNSRIPKYQQVIESLEENILNGQLSIGDRLPSINKISKEYFLSRDTVEKALNQLKKKNVIRSIKGIGYYIHKKPCTSLANSKVLWLLDQLSDYKMDVFKAFVKNIGPNVQVDLNFYYWDPSVLLNILKENMGVYDYYVVVPHFADKKSNDLNTKKVIEMLDRIPADKLVVVDNYIPDLENLVATVCQDYKNDIYLALKEGAYLLQKYHTLNLIFPFNSPSPYPFDIINGFKEFCHDFDFNFQLLENISSKMELHPKNVFITIEEMDLVFLMRRIRDLELTLGRDIGVISYNDTISKELLNISVISTDFTAMGEITANMIRNNKREVIKNDFRFIDRGSV